MKTILTALVLVPQLAFAHSAVTCDTFSDFGDVKLTITSETSMSELSSVVRVFGDGMMQDVHVTATAENQPTLPDQAVLKLVSQEEEPIEAILTLKTKTISENPLVRLVDGVGNLQITKRPPGRRGLRSNYVLSNCAGVL